MITSENLELLQLRFDRGFFTVFEQINLNLRSGDILHVQGENGSGKTTLLRILAGLNVNYSGMIRFGQSDIRENLRDYQSAILYLGHKPGIRLGLTVYENCVLFQKLSRQPQKMDLQAAIAAIGLTPQTQVLAYQLSAGQQRRVALAKFLLQEARVWLLDEPFSSLDKSGIEFVQQRMLQQADAGGIVICTSHQPLNISKPYIRMLL